MGSSKLTVVAEIVAKPGKELEVQEYLLGFVAPTRKEPGCVQYDLHVVNGEPGRFLFYENWDSEADLEAHSKSSHISVFRAVSADLLLQPTRILKATRIA